jgi:hypothetical protein
MDATKLVVGQFVNMVSNGIYGGTGKITKVTPDGVEVKSENNLLCFDNEGNELDGSRRDRLGFGPNPKSPFETAIWYAAPEFQAWQLLDDTD